MNFDEVRQFGNFVSASDFGNIYNLSNYRLSELENLVLAHGLNFCLPITHIKQEELSAEFEVLICLLQHHSLTSKADFDRSLACLNDLAQWFCGSTIDFNMQREFFKTIK